MLGDRDGANDIGIARIRVARRVAGERRRIGGLPAAGTATEIATQQPAVDVGQRPDGRLGVAAGGKSLGLHCQKPRPQRREVAPRPFGGERQRLRHVAGAGGHVRRKREPKRLFERPHVAVVGGGVGGLLEELGRCGRLIAVERDAAEDDQPPGGERMIEPVLDQQAAVEKRCRLIRLALRPVGNAQRDVDP